VIRKLMRRLIASGTICLLGVIPVVAGQYSYIDISKSEIGSIEIKEFNEAPELRVKVAAGEIPSVEKRLPEEPLVVEPAEEIGEYGGTWRWMRVSPNELWAFFEYEAKENLVRYSPDFKKIFPNVAKDFKWSEDGKTVTFYLRKGMKWSDGAPFTADDFVFWYEDIILNDELTPAKPGWLRVGKELGKLEKIDAYTFKITFAQPYGVFTEKLSGWWAPLLYAPKHYLKQFHPKYTPMEKIKEMMKKEGFDRWTALFGSKNTRHDNPELPVITAWHVIDPMIKPLQRAVRNPYYWKIDTEGNQLPYINRIQSGLVSDAETLRLKAIAGDIDFQYRRIQLSRSYTLAKEYEKKGDYRIWAMISPSSNMYTILLNYTHKDPVLRKLFWDKRFRIALSIAINRDEMNALSDQKGFGTPSQVVPAPGSVWYDEELAKLYTEYDPEKANKILDEIGLKWDKKQQYRLRPDGKELKILINSSSRYDCPEMAELIKGYWQKIGINAALKPLSDELFTMRKEAADYDVLSSYVNAGYPGWLPTSSSTLWPIDQTYHTAKWGFWYATGGKSGEEPPAIVKHLRELYDEAVKTTSSEKRIELIKEAVKINVENLLQIGVVIENPIERFGIAKNNFRNVPEPPLSGDLTMYQTASWFIKK